MMWKSVAALLVIGVGVAEKIAVPSPVGHVGYPPMKVDQRQPSHSALVPRKSLASCAAAPSPWLPVSTGHYTAGTQTFEGLPQSYDCMYHHQIEVYNASTNGLIETSDFTATGAYYYYYSPVSYPRGQYKWRARDTGTDLVYGPWSSYMNFTVLYLPTAPSVSGSISSGLAHLSWSPVDSATSYRIYRQCVDANGGGSQMEYWDQTTNTSWTAASDYVSSYLGTYSTMQPRYVYMVQSVGADGAGSGSSYQYFELTYPDSPDC